MIYTENTQMTKSMIKAPCVYKRWNRHRLQDVDTYPDVDCFLNCERCGWNPEVKKQRLEKIFNGYCED